MSTIHIIEDNKDLLEILGDYFVAEGFNVIDDFNGDKFSSGTANNADVYLIDIALINKSGLDISRQIKSGEFQKPVILMSGNFHEQSSVIDAAADAFILKPFQLSEMIDKIKSILPAE